LATWKPSSSYTATDQKALTGGSSPLHARQDRPVGEVRRMELQLGWRACAVEMEHPTAEQP
jgi:hypothetical protein